MKVKVFFSIFDKSDKKKIFILFFLTFVATLVELLSIGFIIPILNLIISPDKIISIQYLNNFNYNQILFSTLLLLVIIYFLKSIFLAFFAFKKIRFIDQISVKLSEKVLSIFLKQPYNFFLNTNTSKIIRDVMSETSMYSQIVFHFIGLLTEVLIVLGILIFILYLAPSISFAITIILFLFTFLFYKISKTRILEWAKKRQFYSSAALQSITQSLNSIKETKILGKEGSFLQLYEHDYRNEINYSGNVRIMTQMPRLLIEFFIITCFCLLVLFLTYQNKSQDTLITILGFSAIAAFRLMPSVGRIIVSAQQLKFCIPSYNTILDIYKTRESVDLINKNIIFKKNISFNDVYFSYNNNKSYVLRNIDVNIEKGQCVGIFGSSGAGKTTFINLILGLLNSSKGKIIVDEKFIIDEKNTWQKEQIGYVPQNIYMTDDTLKKNIAFGISESKINMNSLSNSIKDAQLTEFLKKIPKGFETKIGELGSRISGGEKQRIAIARALYHNPELLILDEPTSSLDENTEKDFFKVINELKKNKTILIISHKLSVLEDCDVLYELKDGRIIKKENPLQTI